MLKCNLCDFSTIKNNTKTRSDFQSSTLARATHRRLVEHKIRIHIKEEHAESLPDANYLKGKFYKENIIYLDEKGNVESSEPEKKTRGSPRTFSKKRKRAASWAPENDKTGEDEEENRVNSTCVALLVKNEVPEYNYPELGIDDIPLDSINEFWPNEDEDERVAKKRKKDLENAEEQMEDNGIDLSVIDEEFSINGYVIQLSSYNEHSQFDASTEIMPLARNDGSWEECPIDQMFPGFPREKREWTPVLLDDGEIGKTKAFRFIPETGECSETFIGRVGFFSSNPFIRKKPDDKTTGLTKQTRNGIEENVLNCIGSTPLVRVNNIIKSENLKCDLLVKCEFFNAGGSVKDRIAKRMIEAAEAAGKITPGVTTIIEPTSGNTGVGLALQCAVKGYKCIICLPEKMSMEKIRVLKALGAEIIRTRNSAAFDDPDSHISIAKNLEKTIPNAWIPDQYTNENNPDAHYYGTGAELIEQTGGKIDVFVAGAGTGGTIAGTAKILKEKIPGIRVVGVDPYGSILAQPASLNTMDVTGYEVEGIGYDFIPDVLNRDYVDEWRKCTDEQAMPMARRLLREEGLLCGGSCGSAFYHALEIAKTMPEGTRVVCILPDSIRNYMTKHLMDEWMWERDFFTPEVPEQNAEWYGKSVRFLPWNRKTQTINEAASIRCALGAMKAADVEFIPVADEEGTISGVFSQAKAMEYLLAGTVNLDTNVLKCYETSFKAVNQDDSIGLASRKIQNNGYVFVLEDGKFVRSLSRKDIFAQIMQ